MFRFLQVVTLAVSLAVAASAVPVKAAVVIEPTLADMVAEAEQIVVARAISSRSYWKSTAEGQVIETAVTFQVAAVIKGNFSQELTLRFLGGRVGDMEMKVSDQVEFRAGDRDLLFVNDAGNPVSPIVGFMYGRFRITNEDVVLNHEGQPFALDARGSSGSPRLLEAPMSQGTTLSSFIAHIRMTARAAGVGLR